MKRKQGARRSSDPADLAALKPIILEQLGVLERAAALAVEDGLPEAVAEDARTEAHKLSGSLGSLGSPKGSRLAAELESLFATGGGAAQLIAERVEALRSSIHELSGVAVKPRAIAAESIGGTVLLIDFDPAMTDALRSMLEPESRVVAVSEPWDALERETPVAILVNVEAASSQRIALCHALRRHPRSQHACIVILTGREEAEAAEVVLAAGADDYVTKPVAAGELIARLSARIRARRSQQVVDVVYVEDDVVTSILLQQTLDRENLTSLHFETGTEAIAALRADVCARVILLDIALPGLDGFAVLQRLSESDVLRQTRVIMLTARSSDVEVDRARELGAFDHVAKPFSIPVLVERIRCALES